MRFKSAVAGIPQCSTGGQSRRDELYTVRLPLTRRRVGRAPAPGALIDKPLRRGAGLKRPAP